MENTIEKTSIGVLIVALISLGITVMPEDTHYSECLNLTMHCERLSSTELTCYPHSDDTKGKRYSSCGWDSIINDSKSPEIRSYGKAQEYLCNVDGCIPKPKTY